MFVNTARRKSLFVHHLHMGGPNADALEWAALLSPRFEPRLKNMGVTHVSSTTQADIVVVTGLLLERNLDSVLAELAKMPSPSVLIAAGDSAINGGEWAASDMPTLSPYPLTHYADVAISVPGNPPTPQALIAALAAAAKLLSRPPSDRLAQWKEET